MNLFNKYYIFTNVRCGGLVPHRGKDFRIERHCFHTVFSLGKYVIARKFTPTIGGNRA